jgi:hypothetical protein
MQCTLSFGSELQSSNSTSPPFVRWSISIIAANRNAGAPNPEQFALEYGVSTGAEKTMDRNRRNPDRSPRQKIAPIVEWRKQRHSQPAAHHRVEHSVTCRSQKHIGEQGESPDSGGSTPEDGKGDYARQESGENQRMRESAMPPEVALVDTEAKPDHIEVGKADCAVIIGGSAKIGRFRDNVTSQSARIPAAGIFWGLIDGIAVKTRQL